jgi:nucleoside-diphosphate-sugar epimerase
MGEAISSGVETSTAIIRKMMMNELYGYPTARFHLVDVKDCSLAHLRALERPDAANKRFILSLTDDTPMIDIGTTIRDGL